VFDAFNAWRQAKAYQYFRGDPARPYYNKMTGQSVGDTRAMNDVDVRFHGAIPDNPQDLKTLFSIRSAYRNEPDFVLQSIQRSGAMAEKMGLERLIDNDATASSNYQFLVASTLDGLYSGEFDDKNGREIVDHLVGRIRESMKTVFGDLILKGPGDPLNDGTFLFDKGDSIDFAYKNLSGGEKAAFELLLDLVVKVRFYTDSVFCVDEPEVHLNSRIQGPLLREMIRLIPEGSQLWIATHSIGMMREARNMKQENPDEVVFLDFFDRDFDTKTVIQPAVVDRNLWRKSLDVAIGDLADLIAPRQVVLCEGRPASENKRHKAELDAECFRTIFGSLLPDVVFISVGNEREVRMDSVQLGPTIETLIDGTSIIRIVDRDDRSLNEIEALTRQGVRVLSLRNLESYLFSDEILKSLVEQSGRLDLMNDALQVKQSALCESRMRGNSEDDIKSAAGEIYVEIKKLLGLTGTGSTVDAFKRDTLAPLIIPGTKTYEQLHEDIFGA